MFLTPCKQVGFEINNIVHVNNYIQKAEQTPNIAVG